MKKKILLILIPFISVYIYSQDKKEYNYRSPLDIPLALSANFGELRPNHFHSGLDFRTQSVVNKNVYSIEDGYIARIGVNAGGYGLVLYINHSNGHTSVYAHLNSFSPKIAKYVKEKQYEQEHYTVDLNNIPPETLPVKRGEFIAKSGNTGSSGGPHVHFELRDTQSQMTIDPLPYYMDEIKDDVSPEIRSIAVYPINPEGVVNGKITPFRENLTPQANRNYPPLKSKIEAWGTIGIGIHAIDRMSGTSFVYGIKEVNLYCDDNLIFSSNITSVDFSTSKMINSFVDFNYWRRNKKFYIKSFIDPGNQLHIYDKSKRGYINIDEEREYTFRYDLKDVHENVTTYTFKIEGKRQEIPTPLPCSLVMNWKENNTYVDDYFFLNVPKETLYQNVNFTLNREESRKYYSPVFRVHNNYEPMNGSAKISIQLLTDTLPNKEQYGIISFNDKGKEIWIGGSYSNGTMNTKIRELGQKYAVSSDTQAPEITPVSATNWTKNERIVIKLTDDLSGIKSFKGTIDGNYALFEHDTKSPNYIYKFDPDRLSKGKHELEFTATDRVGNTTTYTTTFTY